MAKKVRKDGERKEEKKVIFEPPEFDKREYLEEQIKNIKINIIFILYAIPFGVLGAYLGSLTGSGLSGFGVAIAGYIVGILVLRIFTDIDIIGGPKRQLAASAAMFIFTFLAFSILFSNPPVNDPSDPSITDVMVFVQKEDYLDGEWEVLMVHKGKLPSNKTNRQRIRDSDDKYFLWDEDFKAQEGDNLTILVRAADAAGLRGVWIQDGYAEPSGTLKEMEKVSKAQWDAYEARFGYVLPYELWGEHYYQYVFHNVSDGNFYYRVIAEDINGHKTTYETPYEATVFIEPKD
jgi:hypothetical protein